MLYYLVTITKREYGDAYLRYFYENGVHSLTAALCEGTAQQKTLDRLGIERRRRSCSPPWCPARWRRAC